MSRFRESAVVPGFDVFDTFEAREELDRRAGMLVRSREGRLEVNRPVVDAMCALVGVKSANSLQWRGVLLVFDPGRRRAGLVVAPHECPPGKRQPVVVHGDPTVRAGLSVDWPLAVDAREFFAYWGLLPLVAQERVELVDGVFVFEPQTVAGAAWEEQRARLYRPGAMR